MDSDKIAADTWKATRDSTSVATNLSLLLFAALIVSWMGMWDHVNNYRSAVASRRTVERHNRDSETLSKAEVG